MRNLNSLICVCDISGAGKDLHPNLPVKKHTKYAWQEFKSLPGYDSSVVIYTVLSVALGISVVISCLSFCFRALNRTKRKDPMNVWLCPVKPKSWRQQNRLR